MNPKTNLAIGHKVRLGPNMAQMADHRRPAPAHFGGNPVHAQLFDPPFACQLGMVDDISLPGERVKRRYAQNACFE